MADRFRPAWWLRGAHAQTLWGKVMRRTKVPTTRRERWELPDGDFLELERLDAPSDQPRLLLLHGLEGSPRSHYVRGFFAEAHRQGWAADLLIFRTCGDEPNRLLRSYHSGETGDLDLVVTRLLAAEPERMLLLAGVSLGANVMLKWLGERGAGVPAPVVAAAAISTPFDLARGSRFLERGFSRLYGAHFLRTLKDKAREKSTRYPGHVRREAIEASRSLWEFDDVLTAPIHGFRDAADYYARSSSIRWLSGVRVPTLLLSAEDDPFLPASVLHEVRMLVGASRVMTVEFSPHGGHVGFVEGEIPGRARYYAERRAVEFLARHVRDRVDAASNSR